jgi:FixJ family two-component response regulator
MMPDNKIRLAIRGVGASIRLMRGPKGVARRVELAPRTVERHIENVRLKLNARNSAHMVACAFANGKLTADVA